MWFEDLKSCLRSLHGPVHRLHGRAFALFAIIVLMCASVLPAHLCYTKSSARSACRILFFDFQHRLNLVNYLSRRLADEIVRPIVIILDYVPI